MGNTRKISEEEAIRLSNALAEGLRLGVHVDELLPGCPPDRWLDVAYFLVAQAHQACQGGVLVCCLPMKCYEKMSQSPGAWDELNYREGDEPPSFAFLSLRQRAQPEHCEEYRCTVPLPFDMPSEVVAHAYYREFRDSDGMAHDWEFERGMYIEVIC